MISKTIEHYWVEDTPYGEDETVDNLRVFSYDVGRQQAGGRLPDFVRRQHLV